MDIELGKAVMSQDGEQIGTVDRLIVEPEARVVQEFLIKQGTLLRTDRVVDIELVTAIDDDGTVHISIPADSADSLPGFVEHRYVAPEADQLNQMPQAWMGAHGGGPLLWANTGTSRGEPGEGSLFEPASVPSAPPEPEGALDDASIVIDTGTNVVDRDGESFGSVEEIHYDPRGRISGFRVKSGTIFSSEYEIPLKWIDSMQPDAIHLSITSEEAESAGSVDS